MTHHDGGRPAALAFPAAPGEAGLNVPLSIWPGVPPPRAGLRPCPGPVTEAAAARIITAFSRPGDLVAAPDGSAAVTSAAAAAGRCIAGLAHASGGRAPGGPEPSAAATLLAAGSRWAGQTALAIAGRHGPSCCADAAGPGDDEPDDGLVYAASCRVLAPGGVLAVITASPVAGSPLADLAGHVVACARAAGLVYAQHIVLVHAVIDGEQLTAHPAVTSAAGSPGGNRAHSDLLIFTKPGRGATAHD